MTIWIDAQISPYLADWIKSKFNMDAIAIRDLGLQEAKDKETFYAARSANVIVITKDIDFKILQDKWGSPTKIIWLTCGNTSNERLKEILSDNLFKSLALLESGEQIVEISGE